MAGHEPVDLIHLGCAAGGGGLVVRVGGQDGATCDDLPILAADLQIGSTLVSGGQSTAIFPEGLDEWGRVLDALASGHSAAWREDQRATEVHILLDEEDHSPWCRSAT